tara:strand:- start:1118 stop:1534 length:417 start_codon:yes stop_codon:yes gene_type:complete
MDSLDDLRKIETLIGLYEHIQQQGFNLRTNGEMLTIDPPKNATKEQSEQITTIVRANKSNFISLIGDPESMKLNLARIQKRMVQGQRYVLSNLDLWDRLEKMYRQIVPEDNKCINDSGCDEEVLVNCKACEVKYEKST